MWRIIVYPLLTVAGIGLFVFEMWAWYQTALWAEANFRSAAWTAFFVVAFWGVQVAFLAGIYKAGENWLGDEN